MRRNIIHRGADELTYEIRGIVAAAKHLESLGQTIIWENIGDPVAKGVYPPDWIRQIVADEVARPESFGYCPTAGVDAARAYISQMRADEGITLPAEDILFFNGLGDAISIVYSYLRRNARVIGPDPAYPTHSSAEAAHAESNHLVYRLRPDQNWLPDIDDLYNQVRYNPNIAGILIINPDNPTGMVYPRSVLERIVAIAREFDLFIVSDEIYANLAYGPEGFVPIYQLLGDDVPAIVMRGLSKEIPWPGSRCGWIEFHNRQADEQFDRYAQVLIDAKMLQVCATTLPQRCLPQIFADERYAGHVEEQKARYRRRGQMAHAVFSQLDSVHAPMPQGAFYYSVVFKDEVLNDGQSLPIADDSVREYVEGLVEGQSADKRFCYYLMGATGICVVPLSGFNSDLAGFRMTLLEGDEEKFGEIVGVIKEKIVEYTNG